jgi:hypothetical protein
MDVHIMIPGSTPFQFGPLKMSLRIYVDFSFMHFMSRPELAELKWNTPPRPEW